MKDSNQNQSRVGRRKNLPDPFAHLYDDRPVGVDEGENSEPSFGEMLDDDTVLGCVPQPDDTFLVFAEDCGPAPNAVDVFADHTDRTVTEIEASPGEKAYRVSAA